VIEALMSKDPAQRPDAARARQLLTDAAAALGAAPAAVTSARAEPVLATASPVSVASSAALSARPAWAPASGGPGGASAKTDPIGFPASEGPTAVARQELAILPPGMGPGGPPGMGPGGFLASPPRAPFARGTGTSQFPAGPGPLPACARPGLFPAAAGPAAIPATEPAPLPVSMGGTPPPVSMGGTPPPVSMGGTPSAGMDDAPPADLDDALMRAGMRPARISASGAPPAPRRTGRPVLVLGLAGAAVALAALVWWLVAGPSGHGHASGASGGAATAAGSLPAGYRWYARPAAAAGAPGFRMAAPAGWQVHRRGATTYLRNPVPGGVIGVTLAPAAPGGPVWEARMLERAALARGTFTGYRRIAITPFLVRGILAGAWRFSYRPPGAGLMEGLVVVTRVTAPGTGRPYELVAAAPAASWPQTMTAFAEAARTFRPAP
jgi:hypothetical protein